MNKLEMKLQTLNALNRKMNGQRLGNYIGIGLVSLMLVALLFRTRFTLFSGTLLPPHNDPRLNVFKR